VESSKRREDSQMENNYDVVLEDIIYKITMAAAVANNFVSLPITIAVNGLVLTGELISVLEYFHYYAERIEKFFLMLMKKNQTLSYLERKNLLF
jgi:hypothetical protein